MNATRTLGAPRVPSIVPILNPLMRRVLGVGLPAGPNVLLTVRGRKSGEPRSVAVAILELEGRRFVQSPFGEVQWVQNLRAAGEATITKGRHREDVTAAELSHDDAADVLRDGLAPFLRRRAGRMLVGWLFGLKSDATAEDYAAAARTHPMFELRPR